MRGTFVALWVLVGLASGCGGAGSGSGSGGSPTAPGPATTSVAVTLRDVVLVGTTAPATATATLSNGQTQSITAEWRSDAIAVATVTNAGNVAGIANGEATIIAASGGREGSKRIRVAPNYDGTWRGSQVITSCRATADFVGICEEEGLHVGASYPVSLVARHPGELTVSGEFIVEDEQFPTFTAAVQTDGAINFSSSLTLEGITAEVGW